MENEPLISVIVPVYNVEKYLEKCVNSILAQTYRNLEIILVDDGSTDSSGKMCDELKERDPRIKVIHKENGGLSSARNAALDVMTGQYISFIDSDDYIGGSYIGDMYERISKDESDLVISGFTSCDESGNILGSYSSGTDIVIDKNEYWDWVILRGDRNILYGAVEACFKLYRSIIFRNLRFPVTLHEDEAVLYDVINNSSAISIIDNSGYYYYQRSDSITHKNYSVEHLAAMYVFIDRSKRFLEDGFQKYAECTLMTAAVKISEGMKSIPNNKPGKKETAAKLMVEFRAVGKLIRKESRSWKFRIKSLIFSLSPALFGFAFVKLRTDHD